MNPWQQLQQVERHWGNVQTRLRRFWQLVIYAVVGLGFYQLWVQRPEKLQGWSLVLVITLVCAYLVAFESVLMSGRFWPITRRLATGYLTFQIIIFTILSFWARSFTGLGFALIAQTVSILPAQLWPYPVLLIIMLLAQISGLFDTFPDANWVKWGVFLFDSAIFTGLFVAFELVARQRTQMKTLVDQVQQAREEAEILAAQNAQLASARQQTIAELEATRLELAAIEREAGMLEERQRLARDIHDTVAQSFTSMLMHLEAAEPDLAGIPPGARQHVEQARRSAREGLGEARRLVWALRPEILEQASLPEALQRLTQSWSSASGVATTVRITGSQRSLPTQLEVTLLRVVQEALANVRKHARANSVNLTVSFIDDTLLLDVQDDGIGFESASLPGAHSDGGYGLTSMRERVSRLGGTLTLESAPGEGTTLVVEVPTA